MITVLTWKMKFLQNFCKKIRLAWSRIGFAVNESPKAQWNAKRTLMIQCSLLTLPFSLNFRRSLPGTGSANLFYMIVCILWLKNFLLFR